MFNVLFICINLFKYTGEKMTKLQEHNGQYFISLPKLIVKRKKWQKGQELICLFDQDGNIVLQEI